MPRFSYIEPYLPAPSLDLQTRFYQGLCLVATIVVLGVITPINLAQRLPADVTVVAAGFGLVALAFHLAARRGHYYITGFFVALMVSLNLSWFPNAGDAGSVGFFFFVPIIYAVVFWRGLARWVVVALVIGDYVGLLWLSGTMPALNSPFAGPTERLVDLTIGFVTSGVTIASVLAVVLRIYHEERERLRVTGRALADSREQLAQLFEVNPDAVVVIDAASRQILDVNDGFARLTGWARDEVVGRTTLDLDLWVDPSERDRFFHAVSTEPRPAAFLARLRSRDGRQGWASLSAGALEIDGRPCLLIATRDVTALIDAQRETAESQARLATLIDSTDDLIWMVDPDLTLTTCNAAFKAHVEDHYGLMAVAGASIEEFTPPELIERWRGYYRRALASGAFTEEYVTLKGAHTLLVSVRSVRHGEHVRGVSVFARDITVLKHADAERERMRLELIQAQKLESLGSLAGGVAHDFNNMLGGIMGYADILLSGETAPERRDHLTAILGAAARSSELTRKLLAFARRGRNIVEAVEIGTIVRESVAMLRPTLEHDVSVDLRLDDTWSVDGDPGQISQIVLNLCINASEAMPDGGRLEIGVRDVELAEVSARAYDVAPGPYVELSVCDTGVGMPDHVRSRIFEPFFTTKVGGEIAGTGLGLSTVYGIVHLHRGAIDVRSATSTGTTFLVYLPKGDLPAVGARPAAEAVGGAGLVLVVEDEEMLRRLAATALAHLGYRSVAAADGVEGVAIFRARRTELTGVILDLKMPKMGGREAFIEMQAVDSSVPVLICSGYGDNEEAQGLISMGARGLLSKPYRIADLAERLAQIAVRSNRRPPPQTAANILPPVPAAP